MNDAHSKWTGEKTLLRLFMRSADLRHFTPIYQHVVRQAARHKLAGVTVLRGIMGYGSRGVVRSSDFQLLGDCPVIVEVVDEGDKIAAFLNVIQSRLVDHGMATLERAGVMMYRAAASGAHDRAALPGSIPPLSTVPEVKDVSAMHTNSTGVLLRIFIGESDTFEDKPLHEAIVTKARELGISGATVLQGAMGFGANSVIHNDNIMVMSSDLPIIIEIVDQRDKIELLLPLLDNMVKGGMITMEEVRILAYRHDPADAAKKAAP